MMTSDILNEFPFELSLFLSRFAYLPKTLEMGKTFQFVLFRDIENFKFPKIKNNVIISLAHASKATFHYLLTELRSD